MKAHKREIYDEEFLPVKFWLEPCCSISCDSSARCPSCIGLLLVLLLVMDRDSSITSGTVAIHLVNEFEYENLERTPQETATVMPRVEWQWAIVFSRLQLDLPLGKMKFAPDKERARLALTRCP
jgi:hypothetical protein